MNSMSEILKDNTTRHDAIGTNNCSALVKANARPGNATVMAVRIILRMAEGVPPRSIAAVTLSELAVTELLLHLREIVGELTTGNLTTELSVALQINLSHVQRENLAIASKKINEITCTTIDGFCQRLMNVYPAEASINTDAFVMDRKQASLALLNIAESFLEERSCNDPGGILAALALRSPGKTSALIQKVEENLRHRRTHTTPAVPPLDTSLMNFHKATADFSAFISGATVSEPETEAIVVRLVEMASTLVANPHPTTPSALIELLDLRQHRDLCTKTGAFALYRKKNKWTAAAKLAGLSKADGDRLNYEAHENYEACCKAWESFLLAAASHVLSALKDDTLSIIERYRDHKRASTLLDYDDLIIAARDLLRDREDVRRALGKRFSYVLVDEFQDIDPVHTEIFWRLCGEPVDDDSDWTRFQIRPGALFLAGDPSQVIYRYRGSNVSAYVRAFEILHSQDPYCFLPIHSDAATS